MTREEVMNTLPLINLYGDIYINLALYDNIITIDGFLSMFGDSELTYDSLMANPNATNGWKNQFTAWREQGILN